jgi:hypothetical protein
MGTEKLNDTTFEQLLKVDVRAKTKTKGKGNNAQTYLSWTFAWEAIKKQCPSANYKVLSNENGMPYFADDFGIMIKTEVTIDGETLTMWLPVLDGANNAMKRETYSYLVKKYEGVYPNAKFNGNYEEKFVAPATMFDINTATMRCLVKNFAMFGLGLNIYTGEDFVENETINLAQNSEIMALIQEHKLNLQEFLNVYGIKKPTELFAVSFANALDLINDAVDNNTSILELVNATKS